MVTRSIKPEEGGPKRCQRSQTLAIVKWQESRISWIVAEVVFTSVNKTGNCKPPNKYLQELAGSQEIGWEVNIRLSSSITSVSLKIMARSITDFNSRTFPGQE